MIASACRISLITSFCCDSFRSTAVDILTLDLDIEDCPGYNKAITESLDVTNQYKPIDSKSSPALNGSVKAKPEESQQKALPSLDDIVKNIAVKKALEVPQIHVPNGDTWVFIDPPPKQPEQDDDSYLRYVERSRAPKTMSSTNLFALGSPYFEKAMGPTAQHRVLRRRALVGKLPPHIKYVLDLTPPSEGEEAAYLLGELSCSRGVTKWAIAGKLWRISKTLIGGQEEHFFYDRAMSESTAQTVRADIQSRNVSSVEKEHALLKLEESILPVPLPYTALRHRSAIERVLLAVSGFDPELNSAPKVWTACAVAKYLEVKNPFNDYAIRWLRADPNHHFLEILPEVSLKIADGLQCHDLCRDSFAILVGEEALGSVYRSRLEVSRPEVMRGLVSVYGRKKEDLPEVYQTRIEYASKALVDRVTDEFMKLVSSEWIEELPEVSNLTSNTLPTVDTCRASLKKLLKAYVRGGIYRVLCANYPVVHRNHPKVDYMMTNDLCPILNDMEMWNDLFPRERLLTRSFWTNFSNERLFAGASNMGMTATYPENVPFEKMSAAEVAMRENGVFEVVRKEELETQAILYQRLCHPRNNPLPASRSDDTAATSPIHVPTNSSATSTKVLLNSGQGAQDPFHDATHAIHGLGGNTTSGATSPSPSILFRGRPLTLEEHQKVCVFIKGWVNEDKDRLAQALQFPYEWYESLETSGYNTGIYSDQAATLDYWDDWTEDWLRAYNEGPGAFRRPYDRFYGAFSLNRFFEQTTAYLKNKADKMLELTDATIREATHPLSLSDFLVCLEDSEFKYLPLWAGGCDDGSGGVYDDDVPIATEGFSHPGPNVHLGSGSSAASSEFDFVRGVDSYNTSTLTQASSEGESTDRARSMSENTDDPFVDAEEIGAPSTFEDSDYGFGSTTSMSAGSTADRFARFGLSQSVQMSEMAKEERAITNSILEVAAARMGFSKQTDGGMSEEDKKPHAAQDDDFADIFYGDLEVHDDEGGVDDGNDSNDTASKKDDSDDDMVMV